MTVTRLLCTSLVAVVMLGGGTARGSLVLWTGGQPLCSMVLPDGDDRTAGVVLHTLSHHLHASFGVELPVVGSRPSDDVQLVFGSPETSSVLAGLVAAGLQLTSVDIGDEGFQLASHEQNGRKYLVVYGRTPRAVKHGIQELLFFRLSASAGHGQVDWPLDVVMKPQIAYRGIYMLPIWSAHDSLDSWRRVLRFNSELTLNRNWFWLDGFPVAGHPAISHIPGKDFGFEHSPLASDENVQSLIDLVNDEAMKFYIGGGWMSWHHGMVVGQNRELAREYYFDYLQAFEGVAGFYFEPTGEGEERPDWLPGDTLREMIDDLLEADSEFEVAVAIGRFNNHEYLELMSGIDPARAYWWWCWGDPLADQATQLFPSVLGWHTTVLMSSIHGTTAPPSPAQTVLAGVSTSYDPGMGYGNPWNGWAQMGVDEPRDFDPYTMPYFSHQYWFRERCWNVNLSAQEFAQRMRNRLFDADMPAHSIELYLTLADLCFAPATATPEFLDVSERFVNDHRAQGTPRNVDTLGRMAQAIAGLRQVTGFRSGPAFLLAPDGGMANANAGRDLPFQVALAGAFKEFDLSMFGHGYVMDPSNLFVGPVRVRPGLLDANGDSAADLVANGNRLIETYPFVPHIPGIMGGPAFLNRTYAGNLQDVRGAAIEFNFSQPVRGFGAWILEDFLEANRFVLKVTEVGGATFVSAPLESGNGATLAVEGFLGAVSQVGIIRVVVEQQTLGGVPSDGDFFYLGGVQVAGRAAYAGPPLAPGTGHTFFVEPDGQLEQADPVRDLTFHAALASTSFTEFDFAEFGHEYIMEPSSLFAGSVRVRPNLLNANGEDAAQLGLNGNRLIETYPHVPVVPGIMGPPALLNRTYAGNQTDLVGAAVEFTFSEPVRGFGAWIMDDIIEPSRFVLEATEAGGQTFTSAPLESGNGTNLAIEGFIGVVSEVGITRVVIEQQTLDGQPSSNDFFYLDHIQVAARPACNEPPADIDGDRDVDMDDFAAFQRCIGPASETPAASCLCLDFNGDGLVDETDLTLFLNCCSGPGVPADPQCVH